MATRTFSKAEADDIFHRARLLYARPPDLNQRTAWLAQHDRLDEELSALIAFYRIVRPSLLGRTGEVLENATERLEGVLSKAEKRMTDGIRGLFRSS